MFKFFILFYCCCFSSVWYDASPEYDIGNKLLLSSRLLSAVQTPTSAHNLTNHSNQCYQCYIQLGVLELYTNLFLGFSVAVFGAKIVYALDLPKTAILHKHFAIIRCLVSPFFFPPVFLSLCSFTREAKQTFNVRTRRQQKVKHIL